MANIDLANFTKTQGFKIYGANAGDTIEGISVSGAGDINGDGYDDIIIGADRADPFGRNRAGESYIIFGKESGFSNIDLSSLTSDQGFKIFGAFIGDSSGRSVSSAGDVNNDGYDDINNRSSLCKPIGT